MRGMTSKGHARSMPRAVGIHRERDPHRLDVGGRRRLPATQLVEFEPVENGPEFPRRRAWFAVVIELVPRRGAWRHRRRGYVRTGRPGSRNTPPRRERRSSAGSRLLGQAENALADDVALDLAGTAPDRLRAGKEERTTSSTKRDSRPVVRRATNRATTLCRAAVHEQRLGAVDVEGQLHCPLVHLRPEQLVRRAERCHCRVVLAGELRRQRAQAVEAQDLDLRVVAGEALANDGSSVSTAGSRRRRRSGANSSSNRRKPVVADWPRSNASVELATFHPLLTPPTTLSAGHRASSKNTSQNSAVPSGWVIAAPRLPGWRIGTSR